jgi:hypothetical protein
MSDELKELNILKLILIVRFACVTLDVGHPIQLLIQNERFQCNCGYELLLNGRSGLNPF